MYFWGNCLEFRMKHFRVFMVSIFLGIFSCAVTLMLALDSYFDHTDLDFKIKFYIVSTLVFSLFQVASGVMILHGHSRWVAGIVLLYTLCLLTSLPAIFFQESLVFYSVALCLPLMGLYCLNSARFRLMVSAAAEMNARKKVADDPRFLAFSSGTAIADHHHHHHEREEKLVVIFYWRMITSRWFHLILTVVFALVALAKSYVVYTGLVSGVVIGAGRQGLVSYYSFGDEPWMYGLSMFLHLLTVAVSALFLRLMLLLRSE